MFGFLSVGMDGSTRTAICGQPLAGSPGCGADYPPGADHCLSPAVSVWSGSGAHAGPAFGNDSAITMRPSRLLIAIALTIAAAAGAFADEPHRRHHHDHDRARAALERGEIRPIGEILASAAARVPGDVIGVELEREHGDWVYELKIITDDGRRLEVLVDAATATVIEVEDH
jgi:hypothetical protein